MKKRIVFVLFLLLVMNRTGFANEQKEGSQESDKPFVIEEIRVTAQNVQLAPTRTEVFMEDYNIAGQPVNVLDILKDRAIIDFRGKVTWYPRTTAFR